MYRLCFLSDALAAQGAVQCGECARILRPVRTTQAHSEKIVTADKNIATFSASKQDSQPYLFLTWKGHTITYKSRLTQKKLYKKNDAIFSIYG